MQQPSVPEISASFREWWVCFNYNVIVDHVKICGVMKVESTHWFMYLTISSWMSARSIRM